MVLENPRDRVSGLKFKIWCYFLLFVLVLIVIVWMFQIALLKPLYRKSKLDEIKESAEIIVAVYVTQSTVDTESVARELAYRKNLEIYLEERNADYQLEYYKYISIGNDSGKPAYPFILESFQKLEESGEDGLFLEGKTSEQVLAYASKVPKGESNTVYVLISTPMEFLDQAVGVLNNQLVLVSLIAIVAAFLISWYLSEKIGNPIVQMAHGAKKLAKGQYDTEFKGCGYQEIDELAAALNYTRDELSKTDQLRKELLANVSHDIRTPLTMIRAYAEMIRDLSGDNKQKRDQHTQVIIDEADRLTKLVNDMLDLSKLESGANEINRTEWNLSELVSAICNRFRMARELEGYVIVEHVEPGIRVFADEGKLEQVIYNLISNGINYTGEDKTITVNLLRDKDSVRFEVVDSGNGIPPEELDVIWERYYRASETRKRPVKGSGLGLSIVRTILEAHHAKYGVNSTVGEGSCFYFELRQEPESEPGEKNRQRKSEGG